MTNLPRWWNSIALNSNFSRTEQQISPFRPVCGVCGAPAIGRNFAQNTCESCKAFFRRNALRDRVRHSREVTDGLMLF